MKALLRDLKYLLRGCNSFGNDDLFKSPEKLKRVFGTDLTNTPKTLPSSSSLKLIKPIDTNIIYEVCGVDYHIYYYPSYTRGKNMEMYTPNNQNTTSSTNFEGPHHPMCKIEKEGYSEYIITEDFVKYQGTKEVINRFYKCKDEGLFEGNCDPILITGIIITCYCSLVERLKYYISILETGGEINGGHANAHIGTINRIDQLLHIIKDTKYHGCVQGFLSQEVPNLPKLKVIYNYINVFSQNTSEKDLLRYILDLYYKVLVPGGKFLPIKKPVLNQKLSLITPIKPKRLF
jgi:hypothetical protein